MTDKTDTAALSDQFKSIRDDVEFYEGTQHCIAVPIKLAKALLDLLEAERQRADEGFILIGYAEDGKGFVYEPRHQDRISNPIAIYRRKES